MMRQRLGAWAVALAGAATLFIAWQVRHALLLIFAGVLVGLFLDVCVRGIQRLVPVGRTWALLGVCLVLLALAVGTLSLGGYQIITQADALIRQFSEQIQEWRTLPEEFGLLPEPQRLVQGVGMAFATTFGVIGDIILIAFFAIFAAANPAAYRRGLLSLAPADKRPRLARVLDESSDALRYWMLGTLFAMVIVGISVWLALMLIGVPNAALLGIQAGLFAFIPYVGPIVAAVPIVLVTLPLGLEILAWAMAVYIVIQTVEGYLITPIIHKRAVHLPPLLTLVALAIFGILFGVLGIALATPLMVVIHILVLRLYVEDTLGGKAEL